MSSHTENFLNAARAVFKKSPTTGALLRDGKNLTTDEAVYIINLLQDVAIHNWEQCSQLQTLLSKANQEIGALKSQLHNEHQAEQARRNPADYMLTPSGDLAPKLQSIADMRAQGEMLQEFNQVKPWEAQS